MQHNPSCCPDFLAVEFAFFKALLPPQLNRGQRRGAALVKCSVAPEQGFVALFFFHMPTLSLLNHSSTDECHLPCNPCAAGGGSKTHRELRGEDSPASEGRKPAKGAPVIYRWNQDCARLACCSVGLGSPHRPLQSHSHRLRAVGLKSSAGLIFGRGGQGGRPPGLPWSSSGGLKSPHFYGTGLCLCWASSQLQGAAGGTPAPEDCSVQLDCAHGCSQCPQKVEECRENISDNGSFVLKKEKKETLSGERQLMAKHVSVGLE